MQFSKGAAIHDLLLYGCIGAGIPYEVITKGTLSLSEEYGIKVAPDITICSTAIRMWVDNGEIILPFVTDAVNSIIRKLGLYK